MNGLFDPLHGGVPYLAGFFTAVSLSVGALVLLMVACLANATWFLVLQRAAEAMVRLLPLALLLFVPVALGARDIYPWAGAPRRVSEEVTASFAHAGVWWTPSFFALRGELHLLFWCALARAWSPGGLDRGADPARLLRRRRTLSAVGLPTLLVSFSLAVFDWVTPLEPGWVSDAFGLYLGAGAFAGAVGLVVVFVFAARRSGVLDPSAVGPDHFHALGRVLWVGVILWAYIGFCQFLIVWIGNLPGEIPLYDDRGAGAWGRVSLVLVLVHFILPFGLLLSRGLKRSPAALGFVGAWVAAAHALDIAWVALPSMETGVTAVSVLTIAGFFLGFAALAFGLYRSRSALPTRDPGLAAARRYESA